MENRLAELLRNVVDAYVATGEPVGSQTLVARHRLDVSPATIRNWFAELESGGYLIQPHTSGGRLPTEKGFRFYLTTFLSPVAAGKRERAAIERAAEADGERRVKQVAKTLSELSGLAVVVGWRGHDTFYTGLSLLFAQPEFQNWERVVSLSELLDRLDDTLARLRQRVFPSPEILLGRECPFGSACSGILGTFDGATVGILGPIRMDYQRGFSLMLAANEIMK